LLYQISLMATIECHQSIAVKPVAFDFFLTA
jgi:hypothetical protein